MKKLSLLLLAFFAVAVVACNNNGGNDEEGDHVADSLREAMENQIRAEMDSLEASGDTTTVKDTTNVNDTTTAR